MRITRCIPIAGRGAIARYGALVAVTDGRGPGPDLLLSVLADTAEQAGDGNEFVIRAARAALSSPGLAAWACAGVTADGGLAVLVHGRSAAATVRVDNQPAVTLTVSGAMLPATRIFNGTTIIAILVINGVVPSDPDERFWLGDGVVPGGGLALTASEGRAPVPHTPTMDTAGAGSPEAPGQAGPGANLVDGVLCASGHFNAPGAVTCRQCGIGMEQPPRHFERRPRPPLGELLIDDGTRVPLDSDYVLGREPTLDGDVLAGLARPLRINDPDGTVSRLHLKISLVGWQVEVSDLGSANGSAILAPGGERMLTPFEPTAIEPGVRIDIGHRSMQYVAYPGAEHG